MNSLREPTTRLLHDRQALEGGADNAAGDGVALARDEVFVRSLEQYDLESIVRIDKRITGRDRRAYYDRKISEALRESGVRVSLVAENEGQLTGFVMARVDYGDFGQAETSAIIDTIGVDPLVTGSRIGQALMSQLLLNLRALRVETVRTEVQWQDFGLARFLSRCGFEPAQHLVLSRCIE